MAAAAPAIPAARPAAAFGAMMTQEDYNTLLGRIAAGNYVRPAAHAQAPGFGARDDETVRALIPDATKLLATNNRRKLLGVDFPTMAAAMLASLTAARQVHNPRDLVYDVVMAIIWGYTVSRDNVEAYRGIGPMSMFRQFEIQNRARDEDREAGRRNMWVEGCNANSAAIHLVAYMAVDMAPPGSFLARLKEAKGTPFNPPTTNLNKEQQRLILEAAEDLTAEDREARVAVAGQFGTIIKVVSDIFGATGASVEAARQAADSLNVMEF